MFFVGLVRGLKQPTVKLWEVQYGSQLSPTYQMRGGMTGADESGGVKIHPEWDGDCFDILVGACFGGVAGTIFSFAMSRVAKTVMFAAPTLIFVSAILKTAESQGYLTVNASKMRATGAKILECFLALPVVRLLDGGGTYRRRLRQQANDKPKKRKFLDALKGGGSEPVEEVVTLNEHAVAGVAIGFLFGVVKSAPF